MNPKFSLIVVFSIWASVILIQSAMAATGNEYIWTDEPRYLKGDTAHVYGNGFTPYTPMLIKVTRPDASVVTGDGSETPGSDTISTNVDGNFAYSYYIDGIAAEGTYTVEVFDTVPDPDQLVATTTFEDKAQFMLQGCSRHKGDCTQEALPAWANGATPMDGWTSGVLKGWFELEYVPYRLRINLPKPGDAGTYYITNEHDNLRSGVTGVDDATEFYVGKESDGTLTKTCIFQATRAVGDNPTSFNPCIVTGDTKTGVNDDPLNDGNPDEETTDGLDNDSDGFVDEDPAGSSVPAQMIQDTWAVLFDSGEAGSSSSKWALFWKAHLALGSSNFPGASLHADTTASGNQDVPIHNVHPTTASPADLFINKGYTGTPNPGKTVSFTLQYGNTGGSDASNVIIADDYDQDYMIPSNICCGGIDDGDKIEWSVGTVFAATGPFVLTYDGTIHDGTPDTTAHMPIGVTHIVNTATITTTSTDSDLSDNVSTADILVDAEPNLFVTKMVNSNSQAEVKVGDTVTITLTYGNSDNNDAPDTTLCDDYNEAYLAPVASTITPGGVDNGDTICWGPAADSLPGVIPGTGTLPGVDPVVSYQALVIDNPVDWIDPATITTSDPEPSFKLLNNTSAVQYIIEQPTAIRLSSFNVTPQQGRNVISWSTGAEIDTEGFHILRSTSPGGPYSRITPSMVQSTGSLYAGGRYSFVDTGVEDGESYYYKLEEVDAKGKLAQYGPVVAAAEQPADVAADSEQPNETSVASSSTIVAYADRSARFLSGESVNEGTIARITRDDSTAVTDSGYPSDAWVVRSHRDISGKRGLQPTDDQTTEITPARSSAPLSSIRFKIIDAEGNEVAVASLDAGITSTIYLSPSPLVGEGWSGGEEILHSQWNRNRILLTWYAAEPVKGFHILRSTGEKGPYHRVTKTPIPYIGTGVEGQIFRFTYADRNVQKGKNYYYRLEILPEGETHRASR